MPSTATNSSHQPIVTSALRCLATAMLIVYIVWNGYWISRLAIPPSLFTAMTNLPCPTTGGTRAWRCLMAGDVRESLRYNAMTVPIVALLAFTLSSAAHRWIHSRRMSLPGWLVPVWLGLLTLAWILKLAGPQGYW